MAHYVNLSHIDLDGFSSAFILSKFIKENETISDVETYTVFHTDYKDITSSLLQIVNECEDGIILIISDLNLNQDDVKVITDNEHKFIKVILLDHHITNTDVFETLNKYSFEFENCTNLSKSATMLCYEYCLKNYPLNLSQDVFKLFVKLVNAYDIYKRDNINTFRKGKILNSLFSYYKDSIIRYVGLDETVDFGYPNYILQGIYNSLTEIFYLSRDFKIHEFESKVNFQIITSLNEVLKSGDLGQRELLARISSESYLSNLTTIDGYKKISSVLFNVNGLRTIISSTPLDREMVYDILYNRFDADVIIMYNSRRSAFELRGCSDTVIPSKINLAFLAKKFGGGGHPAAAGFPQFGDFHKTVNNKSILDDKETFIETVCKPIIAMMETF